MMPVTNSPVNLKAHSDNTKSWFIFTLIFLVFDYGRPQDLLPIGFMRPSMILMLCLLFFIGSNFAAVTACKSNQTRMIWYILLLLLIYVPFAKNNYMAFHAFKNMFTYMLFIISVIVCVNSIERLKTLFKVYISLMVYVAIYSLLHNGVGSGNYFEDENDVSLYINMVLPFCFFLLLIEKNIWGKLFYGAALVLGMMAVVVSFSRGGFVGLVVMSVVVWLVSPRKLLILFLISLLAGGAYLLTDEEYKQEMSTVTDTSDSTADDRLKSWGSAWDMFLDNPLGVGGGNFPSHFADYQGDKFEKGMAGRSAHSLWFTLIPELGIVGIILYMRLLLYNCKDILFVRKVARHKDPSMIYIYALSTAFMASLAGHFASATFISVFYYPHFWYLSGIIVATVRVYHTLPDVNKISTSSA